MQLVRRFQLYLWKNQTAKKLIKKIQLVLQISILTYLFVEDIVTGKRRCGITKYDCIININLKIKAKTI